jgi:hypothetical protein
MAAVCRESSPCLLQAEDIGPLPQQGKIRGPGEGDHMIGVDKMGGEYPRKGRHAHAHEGYGMGPKKCLGVPELMQRQGLP